MSGLSVRSLHLKTIAKAAGILAVCTAWLVLVIWCWSHASFLIPAGTWLDRLPKEILSASARVYLSQAGFVLFAFYLTVLVPDLLRRFFPDNKTLQFICRIVIALLLVFGALCSLCGLLSAAHPAGRWLSKTLGSVRRVRLARINILLTPVSLGLILVTWFLPAAVCHVRSLVRKKQEALCRVGRSCGIYGILTVMAFILLAMTACLLDILKPFSPGAVSYVTGFASRNALQVSSFFVTAVLAPIMEEAAFRGLIQNHLKKVLPAWAALVISAVFFGLWHRNLGQFLYTFSHGLLWGILYQATGKVRYTIVLHALNNLFAVMAYSVSKQCVLGRLTLLPALSKWMMGLSPVWAALILFILLLLTFAALETVMYLANGRRSLLLQLIRGLTDRRR